MLQVLQLQIFDPGIQGVKDFVYLLVHFGAEVIIIEEGLLSFLVGVYEPVEIPVACFVGVPEFITVFEPVGPHGSAPQHLRDIFRAKFLRSSEIGLLAVAGEAQ